MTKHRQKKRTAVYCWLICATAILGSAISVGQATVRVSVSSTGEEANGNSWTGAHRCISADGRFVVFWSEADNLDPLHPDTNGTWDVFVHDRDTDNDQVYDEPGDIKTELVSRTPDPNSHAATGGSSNPAISASGRYVVFTSNANDLLPGVGSPAGQTYVHDLITGALTIVGVNSNGDQANSGIEGRAISDDGRFVVMETTATNLDLDPNHPDTNGLYDVYLHDRDPDGNGVFDEHVPGGIETTRVSGRWCDGLLAVEGNGQSYTADISGDGRHITFLCTASNLLCQASDDNGALDVYVFDRGRRELARVSVSTAGMQSNNYSTYHVTSYDGRYVAFWSHATNLVSLPADDRVYVRNRDVLGLGPAHFDEPGNVSTTVFSTNAAGQPGYVPERPLALSRNARYVVFQSDAPFVMPQMQPYVRPLFLDRDGSPDEAFDELGEIALSNVSVGWDCAEPDERSEGQPAVTDDGRFVVFCSWARNLVGPNDRVARRGVYVRDRGACMVPSITLHPVSHDDPNDPVRVCDTATLTAHASGDPPLVFQWRKYGTPGAPNTAVSVSDEPDHISGATSPTLVIKPHDTSDSGMYDCVVTNDCQCSETWCASATLTVHWRLGDMNCDASVDFSDIDPFVRALGGPDYYYAVDPNCWWLNGDCDNDGYVTFRDIDCFVAQLGTGCL